MTTVVVVDTDVVSFLLKGDTRAQSYRPHLQGKTLVLSFMTVAELYQWAFIRNWGKQKLAFRIKKKADGVYYKLDFSIEPSKISVLNSNYKLNTDILRVITTAK